MDAGVIVICESEWVVCGYFLSTTARAMFLIGSNAQSLSRPALITAIFRGHWLHHIDCLSQRCSFLFCRFCRNLVCLPHFYIRVTHTVFKAVSFLSCVRINPSDNLPLHSYTIQLTPCEWSIDFGRCADDLGLKSAWISNNLEGTL
jgi:hypothetical protein